MKGVRQIKKLMDGLVPMADNTRRSYGEKRRRQLVNYLRLIMDSLHKTERLMAFVLSTK